MKKMNFLLVTVKNIINIFHSWVEDIIHSMIPNKDLYDIQLIYIEDLPEIREIKGLYEAFKDFENSKEARSIRITPLEGLKVRISDKLYHIFLIPTLYLDNEFVFAGAISNHMLRKILKSLL